MNADEPGITAAAQNHIIQRIPGFLTAWRIAFQHGRKHHPAANIIFFHGKAAASLHQLLPFHFRQKAYRAQVDAENGQAVSHGNGIGPEKRSVSPNGKYCLAIVWIPLSQRNILPAFQPPKQPRLRKNGIPVYIYDGAKIEKYLSGKGKIGIIPCFDESWEYFYGGFDDKDVGEFINLPDEPCDELIERITWEKIPEVRLTGGE